LERYLGAVANDSLAFIDLALASAFPLFAIGIEHPLFLQGRFRPVAIEDALDGGCIELAAKFLGK
jgi:hypothetical protein